MADGTFPTELEAHFQKSSQFRVVMAEGCFGGLSPRGKIHCAFYNERAAIPVRSRQPLKDGLPNGPEEIVEVKSGVVREVEVDVVFDLASAVAFNFWLTQRIDQLRQAVGMSDADFEKLKGGLK